MDIPVAANFRPVICVCGTSITAGISPGAEWEVNLQTIVNTNYMAKYGNPQSDPWVANTYATQGLNWDPRVGMGCTVINSGVGATFASNANTDYAKRIAVYAPTHLVLEFGINEIITGVTLAAFLVQMNGIITKFKADFPLGKIIVLTLMVLGEANPFPAGANFNDPLLDDGVNTAAATSFSGAIRYLALSGAAQGLIDMRVECAVREAQFNPGSVIGGILFDTSGPGGRGLHPTSSMSGNYLSPKGATGFLIP